MREITKVLIIEDDPMVSHINRVYTERIPGFQVIKEVNIDNNLLVKDEDWEQADLLLLDIYLPGKDGISILKKVREINSELDVIIISASKDTTHIRDAIHWGVADYLIKPFTFERFKKSLQDYQKLKQKLYKRNLEQKEVDSLLGKGKIELPEKERKKIIRELPKGLNEETLRIIEEFMLQKDEKYYASVIADRLGLSRVTVQRYLQYMYQKGLVEISREYGTVGRPRHHYRLVKNKN